MLVDIEAVATDIVDAAIKVHRELGAGLLESAYQFCYSHELRKRGRKVLNEVSLPLVYDGEKIDIGYRIDSWIDNLIIVEHKTVETLMPIHEAQLITYLKLSGCKIGFLLNWNVILMKNGIKRVVYNLPGSGLYPKKPSRTSPPCPGALAGSRLVLGEAHEPNPSFTLCPRSHTHRGTAAPEQ